MSRFLLIAVAGFSLFFSGCSKKMPVALPTSHTGNTVVNGDTIPANAVNVGSVGDGVNGSGGAVNSSSNGFKKGAVSSNGKYLGADGVSKSGYKLLYFASDSYTLDDDQINRLMSDLPKIKEKVAQGKVLVEGNCDEFGTDEYNHALGLKRAKTVKSLLVNAGIDASKIDTVSYGESNPTCTIDKPACHAKNRRVEINNL